MRSRGRVACRRFGSVRTSCSSMARRGCGLCAPEQVFGLRWSGAMNECRVAGVLRSLPDGLTELYCHPATASDFAGATRGYRYADELAALTAPRIKKILLATGARSGG